MPGYDPSPVREAPTIAPMTNPPVIAEREGQVALARLNRPETRNALAPEVMERLAALVED